MKAVFGQVIAIAVLSLMLVGVYFYKTTRAAAAEVPAATWTNPKVEVSAPVKEEKVEVVAPQQKPGAPVPAPHGRHVAIQQYPGPQHHGFLYRLFHPKTWKIFHHHAHHAVASVYVAPPVCAPVVEVPVCVPVVAETFVCQPVYYVEEVQPTVIRHAEATRITRHGYRHAESTVVRAW